MNDVFWWIGVITTGTAAVLFFLWIAILSVGYFDTDSRLTRCLKKQKDDRDDLRKELGILKKEMNGKINDINGNLRKRLNKVEQQLKVESFHEEGGE